MLNHPGPFTTGGVARHFGVEPWVIKRLYKSGRLPEPTRFGRYRMVPASDLPAVQAALVAAGYIAGKEAACAS